jgi:hypothetical protein
VCRRREVAPQRESGLIKGFKHRRRALVAGRIRLREELLQLDEATEDA